MQAETKLTSENFYKIFCGILLAVISFIGAQLYTKIIEMNKDLVEIKISLAKLQTEQLTKEDVKEIVIYEITKYHSKN